MLADKKPQEPNPKIAKALETLLPKGDGPRRCAAAAALKNWATPESVPVLMKVLATDAWPPVKSAVIEILCEFKPKEAIKLVAQQLPDGMTQGAAAKYLKDIGPDAEDAVLVHITDKDAWVRTEVCGILIVIGTNKSLPALEKVIAEENWMVNGNAKKAVAAIKGREELDQKK